jgi:hypothetical protein
MIAAFFAAEAADHVDLKPPPQSTLRQVEPFAIWAIDWESVTNEARYMLGLSTAGGDTNLSSRDNFRKIYRDNPKDGLYLVAPVQPYRMNERLTIQQGLFLCANNGLVGFERCLKWLLYCATKRHGAPVKWLYKLTIDASSRLRSVRGAKQDEHQLCDTLSGTG